MREYNNDVEDRLLSVTGHGRYVTKVLFVYPRQLLRSMKSRKGLKK
jgi:hypothetical protein